MKTPKKSYTPEQLDRLNAGLPSSVRHSEGYQRTVHTYSSATAAPRRTQAEVRARQSADPRFTQLKIKNATTAGTYQGHELRRQCVRPGAYAAIDAPSLRNGQRVAPQTPFCSP